VHRHVQPRAERLTLDDHLLAAPQRGGELGVPRLDQQRHLILIRRIQQFELEATVAAVPGGHRSCSPIACGRLVEATLRRVSGTRGWVTARPQSEPARLARTSRRAAGAPASSTAAAGWPHPASRAHRAIVAPATEASDSPASADALEPCDVTCNTGVMASTRERVRQHREKLRKLGLRPIQIWVPDVRAPAFAAEAHRQSAAIAASEMEAEDQAFVDAISWEWDTATEQPE
jgi:Protein  of unknown function (DUF3018)